MIKPEPFELLELKKEFFPNRDISRFRIEALIKACSMVKAGQLGYFMSVELIMASPENINSLRMLGDINQDGALLSQVEAAELVCQIAGCVFVGNPPNYNVFDNDTALWYKTCMRLGYKFCVKYGLEEFLFMKKRLIDSWNKE